MFRAYYRSIWALGLPGEGCNKHSQLVPKLAVVQWRGALLPCSFSIGGMRLLSLPALEELHKTYHIQTQRKGTESYKPSEPREEEPGLPMRPVSPNGS